MVIRKATLQDIPEILDLLLQVATVHHNGRPDIFKANATKYSGEELEKIIQDDSTPVFVAENDGVISGHAFCVFEQNKAGGVLTDIKTLYIDDICVNQKFRRKGIGRAIFEFVVDFAKKQGCYNITLNVWECNPSARKFYESLGLNVYKTGMEKIL